MIPHCLSAHMNMESETIWSAQALPVLPWHSKSTLNMKNLASLGLRLDPTFVLKQFITSIGTENSEINGEFTNLLEASISQEVSTSWGQCLHCYRLWPLLGMSSNLVLPSELFLFPVEALAVTFESNRYWKNSCPLALLSESLEDSFRSLNTVCLLKGEVWVRKISFDPLDPGCLLAIVSSSSLRDPTLRPRISHHNLLSSSQMNVQILFNILEAPGCEFLLLRSLLFLQAGTCQEHQQPQQ